MHFTCDSGILIWSIITGVRTNTLFYRIFDCFHHLGNRRIWCACSHFENHMQRLSMPRFVFNVLCWHKAEIKQSCVVFSCLRYKLRLAFEKYVVFTSHDKSYLYLITDGTLVTNHVFEFSWDTFETFLKYQICWKFLKSHLSTILLIART